MVNLRYSKLFANESILSVVLVLYLVKVVGFRKGVRRNVSLGEGYPSSGPLGVKRQCHQDGKIL